MKLLKTKTELQHTQPKSVECPILNNIHPRLKICYPYSIAYTLYGGCKIFSVIPYLLLSTVVNSVPPKQMHLCLRQY